MEVLFVFAIILVIGLGLSLNHYLKRLRQDAWQQAAQDLGFTFSEGDPYGLLSLPFSLLRAGDGRGIDHVAAGSADGAPTKIFDYWYYEESTDAKGNRSRSYRRFTCALMAVAVRCPPTTIERETIMTRLADAVGFRDQEFESEEFNRMFQVKSTDARFASYLIDARMMEWLLGTDGDCRFELSGDAVLCSRRRIDPVHLAHLVGRARDFHDAMPRVLHDVYGADA